MRGLIVLFALVAAALATPQGRIVGGNRAAEGQFPHQASVRDYENHHLCGGWIYSAKWVVSAAHCNYGRSISNTMVVVGTNSLVEGGYEYEITRIYIHPQFNSGLDHNLALLEILYQLEINPHIQPIPIATENMNRATNAVISGWGDSDNSGNFSETLNWIYLPTLTNEQCKDRFNVVYREYITSAKLCTNNVEGVGLCTGDAGNALIAGGVVIGTASWGFGGCGGGYPDVYSRMSYYADWIDGIVNQQ